MSIWEWAVEAFARPGVSEACLALQDRYGQNASYLLWAVRAGTTDAALLTEAAQAARAWDRVALVPLREARRGLKSSLPPFDDLARGGLREDVKALELSAERVLLDTLASLSERRGEAGSLAALRAAAVAWGSPAPDNALAELAAALG